MFGTLREKKIVSVLAAWQKTVWYPVFYAVCGVLSCSFGWQVYVPVFYLLALSVMFAALFCDDIKVLLVPVFLTYFCIGSDKTLSLDISTGNVFESWTTGGFVNMIIAGALIVGAVAYRFIRDGLLSDVFKKRGILTTGFACITFALVFNGAFSPSWQPLDLAFGLLIAGGLLLMYFVVLAVSNHTDDLVNYICKLCLVCGLMISFQTVLLLIRTAADGNLFYLDADGQFVGRMNRHFLVLGWGVANLIAGMLTLLIPPVMYLAYCRKYSVLSLLSAAFMYAVIVVLNARTSMLMGGVILIVCLIICCFGKNKAANRIFALFFVLIAVLGGIIAMAIIGFDKLPDYIANMLRFSDGDSERFPRWLNGLGDFAKAPVFGSGFMDGGVDVDVDANMYSNMYHNIGVEILGSLGIAGVFAFIVHVKGMLELCLRKFRTERFLIGLGAVSVLMLSLLDNFFFYFSAQIFYGAYLAVAEVQLEYTRADLLREYKRVRGGKPRVAFTFVEAGMGHIVPEAAVCDAFERKYGDKCEVVRSRFYTETDDKDMHNFEDGFVRAVQHQSRSRIFGKLCILGNKLAGDAFAQQFVMSMRYPYSRAGKNALAHLEELDADLLFTTHWATAYYVGKLKENRPYTVMLCPDAYSNGMFNIDCNDFLIPTEEGLKKANHRRMYAGGNGRVVKYPIRDEAFGLVGKKAEVREKLGIGRDEFVVILADGGYGMAKLEKTVDELIASGGTDGETKLRVIAVCGKNAEAAERLRALDCPPGVKLDVYGYTDKMLELVCASDLFAGKSGANSMAEPTFFGLPVIITKCITPIESGIRKYYMKTVGNAMYIPNPKKAAEKILAFASHPEELAPYAERALGVSHSYGAEAIADLLYERATALEKSDENRYTVRYRSDE